MVLWVIAAIAVGLLVKVGLDEQKRREVEQHARSGSGLHDQGLHEDALAEYSAAIGLDPKNPQLHTHRGRALWALGRRSEALDAYQRAAGLDAGSVAAHCDVADALRLMGHPRQALDSARRAVLLSSRSARAHRIMGEALWDLDEGGKAIDALKASAGLHDTAEARVRIAEVRCGQGNHVYERNELDCAIAMEAGSADLHYRRARALLHVAESSPKLREASCRQAITDLEQAIEIDPRHEEAAEMLRRASGLLEGENPEGAPP